MCLFTTSPALKCAFADIICYKILEQYPGVDVESHFLTPIVRMEYIIPSTLHDPKEFIIHEMPKENVCRSLQRFILKTSSNIMTLPKISISNEALRTLQILRNKCVNINGTIDEKNVPKIYTAAVGVIHCYLDINIAKDKLKVWRNMDLPMVLVKCIIPKGSLVIPSYDMTEIGTKTLNLLEVIE